MRKLIVSLITGLVLWLSGVALVLAQQPFFFPIPLGQGTRTQAGTIAIGATAGAVSVNCTGTVTSCQTTNSYTAATSNELLITLASCGKVGSSVTGVVDDGPGLTWTQRSSVANPSTATGINAGHLSIWFAQAVGSFTGKTTASFTGCAPANAIIATFSVRDVVVPPNSWDANVSLPATAIGTSSAPTTGPISTTSTVTMLLSFIHGTTGGCCGAPASPAGWALVPMTTALANLGGCCTDSDRVEYMKVTSTQTTLTVTQLAASGGQWASIGDALVSQ